MTTKLMNENEKQANLKKILDEWIPKIITKMGDYKKGAEKCIYLISHSLL